MTERASPFAEDDFYSFVLQDRAAPCQAAAKADAGQRLAGSQQITFRHFVQGNRDAGSTGVAVTAYVFVKL